MGMTAKIRVRPFGLIGKTIPGIQPSKLARRILRANGWRTFRERFEPIAEREWTINPSFSLCLQKILADLRMGAI